MFEKLYIFFCCTLALCTFGYSDVIDEDYKILASDGDAHDYYGIVVCIDRNISVVGSPGDNGLTGSAYVNRFDGLGWSEDYKLVASDGYYGDGFGYKISTSADTILVGAYGSDVFGEDSGAAYIFHFEGDSWLETKLLPENGAAGDKFGMSVALADGVAVVASPDHDQLGSNSGAVYVFRFNGDTWNEEAKLTASDGAAADFFGISVSISNNLIAIGASGVDGGAANTGAIYIFRHDGISWVEETKLNSSDAVKDDYFGSSISIENDTVVVGAQKNDPLGEQSGSAYLFSFNGEEWTENAKLIAGDGMPWAQFGRSVSISNNKVLVGAPGQDSYNGTGTGSAYLYEFIGTSWVEESKLIASEGGSYDSFGESVSVSGGIAVVGSPYNEDNGTNSGSAYIYVVLQIG